MSKLSRSIFILCLILTILSPVLGQDIEATDEVTPEIIVDIEPIETAEPIKGVDPDPDSILEGDIDRWLDTIDKVVDYLDAENSQINTIVQEIISGLSTVFGLVVVVLSLGAGAFMALQSRNFNIFTERIVALNQFGRVNQLEELYDNAPPPNKAIVDASSMVVELIKQGLILVAPDGKLTLAVERTDELLDNIRDGKPTLPNIEVDDGSDENPLDFKPIS